MNDNCIAPVDYDGWACDCAVDSEGPSLAAIWCEVGLDQVELEFAYYACFGGYGCVVGVDVVVALLLSSIGSVSGARCASSSSFGVGR